MWYGSFQKWRQKKYGNLYISKLNLIKKWIVGEKRYYTKEVWYGLRITNRVGTQPTPICSDSSLCYCSSGTRMSHFSFIEGGTSQIRVWGSASVEGQKIPSRFYGLLQRRVGESQRVTFLFLPFSQMPRWNTAQNPFHVQNSSTAKD